MFRLTPPAGGRGSWTPSLVAAFDGTDKAFPLGGLLLDESGDLYGTTVEGGAKQAVRGWVQHGAPYNAMKEGGPHAAWPDGYRIDIAAA